MLASLEAGKTKVFIWTVKPFVGESEAKANRVCVEVLVKEGQDRDTPTDTDRKWVAVVQLLKEIADQQICTVIAGHVVSASLVWQREDF